MDLNKFKYEGPFAKMVEEGVYPEATTEGAQALDEITHALENNPDLPANWDPGGVQYMARHKFPKKKLTKETLLSMGYKPSLIAVPEIGQDKWTTYRHPRNNLHLHDYGSDWLSHIDQYPSLSMLIERGKEEKDRTGKYSLSPDILVKSSISGFKHVFEEGIPGYMGWMNRLMTGMPGFMRHISERGGDATSQAPAFLSEVDMAKAVPRIGLFLGFMAASGAAGRTLLASKANKTKYPANIGIPVASRRASETAVGASEGLGAGLGATSALMAMPALSKMMNEGNFPPALKSTLFMSTLLGMTLAGKHVGSEAGQRMFFTPGQREKLQNYRTAPQLKYAYLSGYMNSDG